MRLLTSNQRAGSGEEGLLGMKKSFEGLVEYVSEKET